jgi:hypothetical protein
LRVWRSPRLLHSATQFHPFSTLPWDDQYPLHHPDIDQSPRWACRGAAAGVASNSFIKLKLAVASSVEPVGMWATPLRCPHIHRPARVLRHSKCTLERREYPSGCDQTGTASTSTAKSGIGAVPPHGAKHACRGLFHSFWFASMSVFIGGGHDNGTVLLVRGLSVCIVDSQYLDATKNAMFRHFRRSDRGKFLVETVIFAW